MTGLNATEKKRKQELDSALEKGKNNIEDAIEGFNSYWQDEIQPALDEYNETVNEVNTFIQEVKERLESFYESKGEKWQTSSKGEEYSDLIEEWDFELEQLSLEEPEQMEEAMIDIDGFSELTEEIL